MPYIHVMRIGKMLISYVKLDHMLYSINYGITVPPSQANVWVSVNKDLEIHDVSELLVNKRHDALKYHNISSIHRRLKFMLVKCRVATLAQCTLARALTLYLARE